MILDTQDNAGTVQLAKDGRWLVSESQRPKGWESMGLGEPLPEPPAQPEAPCIAPPNNADADNRFPTPPMEFAAIFLPILQGIHAGFQARKTLLSLTQYCIALEISLQEVDMRRSAIIDPAKETP